MADYSSYNGNDITNYYDSPENVAPNGFEYVKYSLDIWVICPLAMILNLTLFIKLVRTPKIKGEPWRWLIGNTSFIIFLMAFLLLNVVISYNYRIPSLYSTVLCPALSVCNIVLYFMYIISTFLVIIERFHALRLGKEGGGFDKKDVILCLSLFWILITIAIVLACIIEPLTKGWGLQISDIHQDICYLKFSDTRIFMLAFIWLFVLPAFVVVFIGTLVLRKGKTTTLAMIRSNVKPTLAASSLGLLLMVSSLTFEVLLTIAPIPHQGPTIYLIFSSIGNLHLVVFPVIWLVTWSKNGDISFQCCTGNNDEEKQLLQPM